MPSKVTTARPNNAKYGGIENGISFKTVSKSCVIAWNPPAVLDKDPSMLYILFNSAS